MKLIALLRKPKIAGMSVFDWLATASAAAIIGSDWISRSILFGILVWTGIAIHDCLGIPTQLNAYLGICTQAEVDHYRALHND